MVRSSGGFFILFKLNSPESVVLGTEMTRLRAQPLSFRNHLGNKSSQKHKTMALRAAVKSRSLPAPYNKLDGKNFSTWGERATSVYQQVC